MDFKQAAILGSCISKDYAGDMFRLLCTYQSISSSEAASRLNLHIKTVQDYMEDLYTLGIADREEVSEGKRPYYRYRLRVTRIIMEIDLSSLIPAEEADHSMINLSIREKRNSGVRFTTSRSNDYISHVIIWQGEGRNRTERKINLSLPQGRFLFHLPFPTAPPLSVRQIMDKAGLDGTHLPEIADIVKVLIDFGVIEEI